MLIPGGNGFSHARSISGILYIILRASGRSYKYAGDSRESWDVCIVAFFYCEFAIHCYNPISFWFRFFFFSRYTIVLIYYAFCLVFMMLLRPLLVKKIACGLGKTDRFKSIYAALYFFPILTVLQAVGGGLLCECVFFFNEHLKMYLVDICFYISLMLSDYAFPYIILVLSLVTLAVYMSASEIQVNIFMHYMFFIYVAVL